MFGDEKEHLIVGVEIETMVERVQSRRVKRGKNGGRRPGSGRRFGSVNEAKKVARARAAKIDLLPHELLWLWARTGKMSYPGRTELLEPSDRIACAKGCAAWYKAAMQPRPAPGEQPPVVRVELDEKMITAMAKNAPGKLEMLRDVLRAIGAGVDLTQVAGTTSGIIGADGVVLSSDPARYGRLLSETSEVDGSA